MSLVIPFSSLRFLGAIGQTLHPLPIRANAPMNLFGNGRA